LLSAKCSLLSCSSSNSGGNEGIPKLDCLKRCLALPFGGGAKCYQFYGCNIPHCWLECFSKPTAKGENSKVSLRHFFSLFSRDDNEAIHESTLKFTDSEQRLGKMFIYVIKVMESSAAVVV